MDLGTLESAYEALVAPLREGGFEEPAEGWPAELVAAHPVGIRSFIESNASFHLDNHLGQLRALQP